MLPVGLCEWIITNVHAILKVMFKNVLYTFDVEILKYSASAQNIDVNSYIKKRGCLKRLQRSTPDSGRSSIPFDNGKSSGFSTEFISI